MRLIFPLSFYFQVGRMEARRGLGLRGKKLKAVVDFKINGNLKGNRFQMVHRENAESIFL